MAALSDFLENAVGDHLIRSTPLPKLTDLYIALFTSAPTDAGGGTEVAGGSYARVNLPASDTNWKGTHGNTTGPSSGTSGQFLNAVQIVYPVPTGDWLTVTHYKIMSAITGGNMYFHGALLIPKPINIGSDPTFPVDAFSLTFA